MGIQTKQTPDFYIRSQVAHEPIITFSEDDLQSKDTDTLEKIYCYQIQSLRLLVGDQIFNVLHNISLIDNLVKDNSK
jgi:hypothetical protein